MVIESFKAQDIPCRKDSIQREYKVVDRRNESHVNSYHVQAVHSELRWSNNVSLFFYTFNAQAYIAALELAKHFVFSMVSKLFPNDHKFFLSQYLPVALASFLYNNIQRMYEDFVKHIKEIPCIK